MAEVEVKPFHAAQRASRPLVSVLIPCFNAHRYIGETLESVFTQSWPNVEVIIIDDGSTDGSADEVGRFSRQNLILILSSQRGAAASRNEALRRSSGDFIQFLDADDLLSASKIELQVLRLRENPMCVASSEWARFYKRPEDAVFVADNLSQDLGVLDWLARSREEGLGMMFPALWLIPRAIAIAAGPWNENLSLADDTEYFTRVLLGADRVLFCPGAQCYYRSGVAGSLSGRKSPEAWKSQFTVNELCQQYVLARENSERMRRGFASSWQHIAHACYPYNRALAERALAHARALHPEHIEPDGGPTFRILSRLLGWRLARRLQVASGRP
jgi:glycosyltransferase involved in cell wall biosynthesis